MTDPNDSVIPVTTTYSYNRFTPQLLQSYESVRRVSSSITTVQSKDTQRLCSFRRLVYLWSLYDGFIFFSGEFTRN